MKYNFVLVLLFVAGCNLFYREKEDKKTLEEALHVHLEATKLGASLKSEVQTLLNDSALPSDSLQLLLKEIDQWEMRLIEVPGADHDDHHHNSTHEPLQLTSEEMLRIQQEALRSIQKIQKKLENLQKNL